MATHFDMNWMDIERADSYVEANDVMCDYIKGKNASPQSKSEFLHGRNLGEKEWSIKDKCLVNLNSKRYHDLLRKSRAGQRFDI